MCRSLLARQSLLVPSIAAVITSSLQVILPALDPGNGSDFLPSTTANYRRPAPSTTNHVQTFKSQQTTNINLLNTATGLYIYIATI